MSADNPRSIQYSSTKLTEITNRISRFKRIAIALVLLGGLVGICGAQALGVGTSTGSQNLGNLGSFLQGTTGALWSLAGLILVYIGFLSQYVQLQLQIEVANDALLEQSKRQAEVTAHLNILSQQLNEHRLHAFVERRELAIASLVDSSSDARGRQCLEKAWNALKDRFHACVGEIPPVEALETSFKFFTLRSGVALNCHTRSMLVLLRGLRQLPATESELFLSHLIASLDSTEPFVFAYCFLLSPENRVDWQPLISRLVMSTTLTETSLLHADHFVGLKALLPKNT